jgi:hypothetical protein
MIKPKEYYIQCEIVRGNSTRVIWANSDKAIVGNLVKVEEDDGSWSEGWFVKSVYGEAKPRAEVIHQSHAHTRQRKSSDI